MRFEIGTDESDMFHLYETFAATGALNRALLNYTMTKSTPVPTPYNFAFTGASMKLPDFLHLARYITDNDLHDRLSELSPDRIMRRENQRTNRREFQELIKRYRALTPHQRELLLELDAEGRKQLSFLAICKTYAFLADFTCYLVREKFRLMDYQLTDVDMRRFLNQRAADHPELDTFAESTLKKAKQVTWLMLEEGGWIDGAQTRRLQPQFPDARLLGATAADHPRWLEIYLLPPNELNRLYDRYRTERSL